nr:immunoglobulin light chain junction region [Macaca mulatta]MPN67492.1 immunoglobulin light chain junction region [Macaca mulatta]
CQVWDSSSDHGLC